MKSLNTDTNYDRFARGHVRHRVAKLVRTLGLPESDCEDLEQEVLVFVYQRLRQFNPSRGSIEAFTNTVVTSKIRNLIDQQTAKMRDFRLIGFSFDETVQTLEGDCVDRKELTDAQIVIENRGDVESYTRDQIDLKVDMDRVIDKLPAKLADLCNALKHGNATDAAEELGISRREATRRIHRLRSIFEEYWADPDSENFAHFLEFVCKD